MLMQAKNFTLRSHKLDDAENIYQFQQEREVKRNFMSVPKSVAEVKKDIKMLKKSGRIEESFVIDVNGEAIGEINFYCEDPRNKTKAKVSYWIAKKARGKGIMTKALKLITSYAFKKYKFVRLYGYVRTFNKPSARVLEKAGYKYEGTLRKNKYKNGKYLSDMLYSKVR